MKTVPYSFSLALPDGWEDRTIYSFVGPDDGDLQHIITLTIDDSPVSDAVAEFARDRIAATMASLQAAEKVKDDAIQLPGGREAWELVYKWVPADNTPRFGKCLYLLIDGVGYVFTGTFTKKTIKTIALEMDQMAAALTPPPKK
ncbi:MAG: DcrB-related protein [Candidatus Zixiibacteriota bacterium]